MLQVNWSVLKIDVSYDDFFATMATATVTCIISVSVGKLMSDYYFVYLVGILCILVIVLTLYEIAVFRTNMAKKVRNKNPKIMRSLSQQTAIR